MNTWILAQLNIVLVIFIASAPPPPAPSSCNSLPSSTNRTPSVSPSVSFFSPFLFPLFLFSLLLSLPTSHTHLYPTHPTPPRTTPCFSNPSPLSLPSASSLPRPTTPTVLLTSRTLVGVLSPPAASRFSILVEEVLSVLDGHLILTGGTQAASSSCLVLIRQLRIGNRRPYSFFSNPGYTPFIHSHTRKVPLGSGSESNSLFLGRRRQILRSIRPN